MIPAVRTIAVNRVGGPTSMKQSLYETEELELVNAIRDKHSKCK